MRDDQLDQIQTTLDMQIIEGWERERQALERQGYGRCANAGQRSASKPWWYWIPFVLFLLYTIGKHF